MGCPWMTKRRRAPRQHPGPKSGARFTRTITTTRSSIPGAHVTSVERSRGRHRAPTRRHRRVGQAMHPHPSECLEGPRRRTAPHRTDAQPRVHETAARMHFVVPPSRLESRSARHRAATFARAVPSTWSTDAAFRMTTWPPTATRTWVSPCDEDTVFAACTPTRRWRDGPDSAAYDSASLHDQFLRTSSPQEAAHGSAHVENAASRASTHHRLRSSDSRWAAKRRYRNQVRRVLDPQPCGQLHCRSDSVHPTVRALFCLPEGSEPTVPTQRSINSPRLDRDLDEQ